MRQTKHTKVLRHGVGLERKRIELVGVDGELLLDRSQRLVVDEEEDLKSVSVVILTAQRMAKLTVP